MAGSAIQTGLYTVTVSAVDFTLTERMIGVDAPNYFTAAFSSDFEEATTRHVDLGFDHDPDLFHLIVSYLRGYEVTPLEKEACPRMMSIKQTSFNLARLARYLQLDRLYAQLQSYLGPSVEVISIASVAWGPKPLLFATVRLSGAIGYWHSEGPFSLAFQFTSDVLQDIHQAIIRSGIGDARWPTRCYSGKQSLPIGHFNKQSPQRVVMLDDQRTPIEATYLDLASLLHLANEKPTDLSFDHYHSRRDELVASHPQANALATWQGLDRLGAFFGISTSRVVKSVSCRYTPYECECLLPIDAKTRERFVQRFSWVEVAEGLLKVRASYNDGEWAINFDRVDSLKFAAIPRL